VEERGVEWEIVGENINLFEVVVWVIQNYSSEETIVGGAKRSVPLFPFFFLLHPPSSSFFLLLPPSSSLEEMVFDKRRGWTDGDC